MIFGSVCSGIEGASVAWYPLGWKCAWTAEIEAFPRAVIAERWGHKNYGDFTKIGDAEPIELLVGGTPCQSFSFSGRRAGLDDPRGNLSLEFLRLADRLRPRWLVWENVPGVLSDDGGRTFGTIVGLLGQLGYGFAYRVLDSKFFGIPQKRRRVFIVGCLGDWRGPAAVFAERTSLSGCTPQGFETREEDSESADGCAYGLDEEGNVAFERFGALLRGGQGGTRQAVAVKSGHTKSNGWGVGIDGMAYTLDCAQPQAVMVREPAGEWAFRRITPLEAERLQGFPDDYSAIQYRGKPATDGHRYKALGNSWAVPVVRWIGKRIEQVLTASR